MVALEPCVFCELIRDDTGVWVAKEPEAVALMPLPADAIAPGHVLVVPTTHCDGVLNATAVSMTATALLVQRLAKAAVSALGATGVCVLNASGSNSGRSIEHLHWHVVPRYPGDGDECLPWPAGRSKHRLAGDPAELLARGL